MSINWKYVWGTATIVVIVGGTIYAIKKSKDAQKAEGESISLAEARSIVRREEALREAPVASESHSKILGNGISQVILDEVGFTAGPFNIDGVQTHFTIKNAQVIDEAAPFADEEFEDNEEEDEMVMEDDPGDFLFYDGGRDPKEDIELRYDPNSRDARNQFIRMELAEWRPLEDNYQTLLRLFDFPFKPQNDGDELMATQVIDYRVRFFGFGSRWCKEVTVADIIMHYSRKAEFNCGENVRYWADYFLEFNELDFTKANHEIDEVLLRLNSHTYFNEERATFGLFGLTRECMDQAIRIANGNVDRSVTYEIEFNEFLKSCV
jgi:hypothetical protein